MISRTFLLAMALALPLLSAHAAAQMRVFACEPEWAALVTELGGDRVEVFKATTAFQDPHRIEARPSLIAQMRRADLAVCSGAGLEVGWMPLLLRSAGNRTVQPGRVGYLEAAMLVERLGVPEKVDRIMGDVHPEGNPHVHLDPHRVQKIARAVSTRLVEIDPAHREHYEGRLAGFERRWSEAIARWEAAAAPLRGRRAVEDHKAWAYLFDWLGIESVATLEPKPGVSPSAGYLAQLKRALTAEPADFVVRASYSDPRPSQWLEQNTGIPVVELPYTVGGTPAADDLFGLFEDSIARLLETMGES